MPGHGDTVRATARLAAEGRGTDPGRPADPVAEGPLARMFALCGPEQAREYVPEKRSFRIHGHSTTIRLERAFWSVLEELAVEEGDTVASVVTRITDHCLVANEKNLSSCLRVVCLKYINVFVAARSPLQAPATGRTGPPQLTPIPVLDLKGLNCPLLILRTRRALNASLPGERLKVLATDAGAGRDFETFCRSAGHLLVEASEARGVYSFVLEKGG